MRPTSPMISVIVPHMNQADSLAACLSRLANQDIDPAQYEVIVVDNGSVAPPLEALVKCSNARMISESQPGPGPARNAGVKTAQGEILAFIDADCRPDRRWLATIIRELKTAPTATILGGDIRIWRTLPKGFTPIEAYESVFGYRSKLYIRRHGYCATGNLAIKRSAFNAIGPFAGIEVAEDMEWGERARSAGFRMIYVPDMIIYHPARRSIDQLYAKWDRHLQHYFNMARGKPGWRTKWILRAFAIAASPAVDIARVLLSDRIYGISARKDAITVLITIRIHRTLRMLTLLVSNGNVNWNRAAPLNPPIN